MRNKQEIFKLLDLYVKDVINAVTFSNEFYQMYDLHYNEYVFTEKEENALDELNKISSRFSQFEEDHIKYPGTYFTEKELYDKALETYKKIME